MYSLLKVAVIYVLFGILSPLFADCDMVDGKCVIQTSSYVKQTGKNKTVESYEKEELVVNAKPQTEVELSLTPYAGVHAQHRVMRNANKGGYSLSSQNPHPKVFAGFRVNDACLDCVHKSVEVGIDLPARKNSNGYRTHAKGFHADLLGTYPIAHQEETRFLFGLGVGHLGAKVKEQGVKTHKYFPRVTVGLDQELNDKLKWRTSANWTETRRLNQDSFNVKNSVVVGTGLFYDF